MKNIGYITQISLITPMAPSCPITLTAPIAPITY